MATPISTYGVVLKYGETTPENTIAIKSFPQLLAERSHIDVTTLSDDAKIYIDGIRQTPESFSFTANWDKEVFNDLNSLDAAQKCELDFPDGSKFTWDGLISVANNEGSVDAVVEMTINVTPVTVPVFTKGA